MNNIQYRKLDNFNHCSKKKKKFNCKKCLLYFFSIVGVISLIFMISSFIIYLNNVNYQTKLSFSNSSSIEKLSVTWTTLSKYNSSYVILNLSNQIQKIPAKTKSFVSTYFNRYIHTAKFNIKSNHTYIYNVNNDNYQSKNFSFKINKKKSLNIIFYGDMGIDDNKFLDLIYNEVKTGKYDFILHLGDIAYDLHSVFGIIGDIYLSQMEKITSTIPYMTICGNHEAFKNFTNYKNRFSMPGNNLFYSLNYPPLKIINLNSEIYYYKSLKNTIQNQKNFLKKEIININRTLYPWVIVTGHRPMYCSNLNTNDCVNWKRDSLRNALEKNLSDSNTTIYLSAHEHNYERICPIFNGKCSNIANNYSYNLKNLNQPIHIISGAAGSIEGLSNINIKKPSWSIMREKKIGFGTIFADHSKLIWKSYILENNSKKLIDNFTIFN